MLQLALAFATLEVRSVTKNGPHPFNTKIKPLVLWSLSNQGPLKLFNKPVMLYDVILSNDYKNSKTDVK